MEKRSKSLQYYYDHKQEVLARQKLYKRQHVLRYWENGQTHDVYGVNKKPYPSDSKCMACRHKSLLCYHHSNDHDITDGIWLCHCCHRLIESLIRNPDLLNIVNVLSKYTTGQRGFRF